MSVAPSLLRSLPGTLFLSSLRVRCHRGVMCRPPRLGTTLRRRTLSLTLLCTFSQLPLYAFAKLNCLRTYLSYARSISCYFGSLHFGNYCGDPYLYVFVVCRCGGRFASRCGLVSSTLAVFLARVPPRAVGLAGTSHPRSGEALIC